MKLFTLLFSFVIFTNASARDIDPKKYSSKLRSFIEDTVYRSEAGDRVRNFLPLPKTIALQFHCNQREKDLILKKIKPMLEAANVTLVDATAAKKKVTIIDIHFGNSVDMAAKALKLDKEISVARGFVYWKWFDNAFNVTKGVIFICTDKVNGAKLERVVAKQLIHVMGLPSEGNADNSLLSEKNTQINSATALDLAILKFLYKEVPVGASPSELKKIVRKKWAKGKKK